MVKIIYKDYSCYVNDELSKAFNTYGFKKDGIVLDDMFKNTSTYFLLCQWSAKEYDKMIKHDKIDYEEIAFLDDFLILNGEFLHRVEMVNGKWEKVLNIAKDSDMFLPDLMNDLRTPRLFDDYTEFLDNQIEYYIRDKLSAKDFNLVLKDISDNSYSTDFSKIL